MCLYYVFCLRESRLQRQVVWCVDVPAEYSCRMLVGSHFHRDLLGRGCGDLENDKTVKQRIVNSQTSHCPSNLNRDIVSVNMKQTALS